ncbi:lipopolysaccharide biosynthesis protein [Enterococcus casseliflavus]|uniref:lipopolysaccharide biosynthesis protein n=1 Tax=Enterococcus casseliflavus TaxID=37734 RepID=UPI0018ABAD19
MITINKYEKLLKNSIVFAIGNFGSKLISVLLVPLYTFVLSSSDYGKIDLVITTINLLLPIVFLSITESVLRFSMDDKEELENTLSGGIALSIIVSLLLLLTYPFTISIAPNSFRPMMKYFLFLIILQQFQALFAQFTRARGKVLYYSINGILLTFLTVVLNILFLVVLRWGISGYFYSLIIANIVSILYLTKKMKILSYIKFRSITKVHLREMLSYSIPMIPNMIMWWVVNSSTRYFILYYNGASENGLYAVASKLPALITMLAAIFSQAWQLSSVEEYNSKDKEDFFSKTFLAFSMVMMLSSSALLIVLKPVMLNVVENSYYSSWMFVPPLVLASVYSSFSGFVGTTYTAAKQTKGIFYSSVIGGGASIITSFLLIPPYGGVGAGISSFVGFFIIYWYRLKDTQKFVSLNIDFLFFVSSNIIYIIQWIALFIPNAIWGLTIQVLLFISLLYLNKRKLLFFFYLIKKSR